MRNIFKKNPEIIGWISKALVIIISTVLTIYFFPKSNRFQYDFNQGEPWEYETLYAPFSFPIEKTEQSIAQEKKATIEKAPKYFKQDVKIAKNVKKSWDQILNSIKNDTLLNKEFDRIEAIGNNFINNVYEVGYYQSALDLKSSHPIFIDDGQDLKSTTYGSLTKPAAIAGYINKPFNKPGDTIYKSVKRQLVDLLKPDVILDKKLTELSTQEALSKIIPTQGLVSKNARIIAQGEIVEGEKLQKLSTLNNAYNSQTWTDSQYGWKLFGYLILVGMAFTMLMLFLMKYRRDIFDDLRKLLFIYFNILTFILLTALIVSLDARFIYIIPVCMLPLILKAFFDARLGLFCHVIAIFILSFIVPNSDEYLYLQMMAGIVTILSGSEIYRRANLFITVGQILFIYCISYLAFYAVNQGGVVGWEWDKFIYFLLSSLAMLFVWPLIYIYEKLFGLVSDVSLLELSDTNSRLLKELSNKAPGTFHHSLNVANIAETVANEIGANAMLVRVGALYHDIGKMKNPTYFTENQSSGINPHDDLDPQESAQIIIDHTLDGIEIAKKNNLPDRIVDFIRTHHGDSLVYYFYKKAQEQNPDVDPQLFRYPGPRPFSQETAILMISDSVEAASKSLKTPTSTTIETLVDNIINNQMQSGQFLDANITFKQIELMKVVLKKKLASIFHLRIEYPE
jgi:putative nucleotidyltransferase with HDIG domain